MNSQEVDDFRKMAAQLAALHQEMGVASKKSSDNPVSSFKIRLANLVLEQASNVLKESAPELGFNQFDPDQLPTVSDLNFVVSQFVECAEKVRCENIARNYDGVWYWKIGGKVSDVITSPPKGTR